MTFAIFLTHPLAIDEHGFPTGGYDKTRLVPATGSDSFLPLDGRFGPSKQDRAVNAAVVRMRAVRTFHGYEIHHGLIHNSRRVRTVLLEVAASEFTDADL